MSARRRVVRTVMVGSLSIGLSGVSGAQGPSCPDGRSAIGDLGIGMYQCIRGDCVVAGRRRGDTVHAFSVEPRLWSIHGPAATKLSEGDVLAAVDGLPVTTYAAGARLATVRPGEMVELLVRRGGRTIRISVVAATGCDVPGIQISSSGGRPSDVTRRALAALDSVTLGGRMYLDAVARDTSASSSAIEALGFELTSVVGRVEPDSPAWRAGLRPGDVIVEIDGMSPTAWLGSARRAAGDSEAPVRLTVQRGARTIELTVRLDRR